MSSTYRKINYVEQGNYGSTIHRTLYARFNASTDWVTIVDDQGKDVLSFGEWGIGNELDLGQAICKLLTEETESMTAEEIAIHKNKTL